VPKYFLAVRGNPNVLLVHFNDLKEDRDGEMRRIAHFLGLAIPEEIWAAIVEAASFEVMRRHGSAIMPVAEMMWDGGAERFIYKGTNGRWQDCVPAAEIARYRALLNERCPPGLALWLTHGRRIAGEPASAAD